MTLPHVAGQHGSAASSDIPVKAGALGAIPKHPVAGRCTPRQGLRRSTWPLTWQNILKDHVNARPRPLCVRTLPGALGMGLPTDTEAVRVGPGWFVMGGGQPLARPAERALEVDVDQGLTGVGAGGASGESARCAVSVRVSGWLPAGRCRYGADRREGL